LSATAVHMMAGWWQWESNAVVPVCQWSGLWTNCSYEQQLLSSHQPWKSTRIYN